MAPKSWHVLPKKLDATQPLLDCSADELTFRSHGNLRELVTSHKIEGYYVVA